MLDEEDAAFWMNNARSLLRTPGSAEWWGSASAVFKPEFRAEVDDLLRQPGPSLTDSLPFFKGPETAA